MRDLDTILAEIAARERARPAAWPCARHGDYPTRAPDGRPLSDACPACTADAADVEARWRAAWRTWERWQAADVPARFGNRTLANWKPRTPAQRKVHAAVRSWAAQWATGDVGALVLSGAPGLGKTHLACGLLADAIADGRTGHYAAVPATLARLRDSYARDAEQRASAILAPLQDAGLLVLDEIAASRGSDWERETLSALVDDRYRDGGGLVIATNAAPSELPAWIGERAADRLAEFGLVLTLDGASYRSAAPRDEALRTAGPAIPQPPRRLTLTTTVRGASCERTEVAP